MGKILREDISADRDLPPFNRATMDGIAVNFDAWQSGQREFRIEGCQKAGIARLNLQNTQNCLEVMTGAVVPQGCDCVIPVENINISNQCAALRDGCVVTKHMNIHAQGSDHQSGEVLVQSGSRLSGPQIAIAASVGKSQLNISLQPKIAVIGTGDELVAVDAMPTPYQIRQSNSYALQALCTQHGFKQVDRFHIEDNPTLLTQKLTEILNDYDVIVLSGGVSMGKFDYIPQVLEELKVSLVFHKVKQRPGKPFWFGRSQDGKPVFALPGNPVSTQVGCLRYVIPYLYRSIGRSLLIDEFARLAEDYQTACPWTIFLPVQLSSNGQGVLAHPITPNSSGDFASLAASHGFLELPASDDGCFASGLLARFFRWNF